MSKSVLTVIIQKTRTWRTFPLYERYLLLQALILLPLVALSLKLWGLKQTHSLLTYFLSPKSLLCATSSPKVENRENSAFIFGGETCCISTSSQILTTANIVKIATKYYNWATCLRKSLVLWYLLRLQGIAAQLQIGTKLDGGEFQAHAWVEYQGNVVGDSQEVQQYYATFDLLDTKLTKNSLNPLPNHASCLNGGNSDTTLSPQLSTWCAEIELLLCCACNNIDTITTERIENLLQKDINWNYLLQQACQHGVFLLLYQNLINNYRNTLPESLHNSAANLSTRIPKNIQSQLQAYCQNKTAQNLFLSKKLCHILELFNTHDIKVIPFKGSVLAASTYKNLTLREFCDIDLLIEETDFPKVKELLLSQGYQVRSELQHWGQDFASRDDKIHIDIHWQVAPSCFPYRLEFQALWQRRQTVSIFNQQVNNLSPEDLLLILCVQIVKDTHYRQEKLKQICDIAELIRNSSLNWEFIIQQGQALGSERLLLFSLAITQQLLKVEIPLNIKQKIARDRIVNWYLDHVQKRLFTLDNKQETVFGIFRQGLLTGLYGFALRALMLLERSNTGKHNKYLVGHLLSYMLTPNSRDFEYVYLPPYLYFLYYLIRPIRLTSKFFNLSSKTNSTFPNSLL